MPANQNPGVTGTAHRPVTVSLQLPLLRVDVTRERTRARRSHRQLGQLISLAIVINDSRKIQRLAFVTHQDGPLPQTAVFVAHEPLLLLGGAAFSGGPLPVPELNRLVADRREEAPRPSQRRVGPCRLSPDLSRDSCRVLGARGPEMSH